MVQIFTSRELSLFVAWPSHLSRPEQFAGARIALELLASRCAPEILDDTIAGLEFLAEHSLYDRDAHRAGLDEMLLVRQALDDE
jgi:hypothetical protein